MPPKNAGIDQCVKWCITHKLNEIEQKLRTWERQTWMSVREIGINAWQIVKKQIIVAMFKPVTYAEYVKLYICTKFYDINFKTMSLGMPNCSVC